MNGAIIAFDPCHACESHDMCSRCELTLRRDGALRTDKWISVEERLPDTTEKILVYCSNGEILPAKYIRVQGLEFWFEETYSCHNITHWMPLPEAPKCGAKMTRKEGEGK